MNKTASNVTKFMLFIVLSISLLNYKFGFYSISSVLYSNVPSYFILPATDKREEITEFKFEFEKAKKILFYNSFWDMKDY